ncbi:MAG: type II secretion system F family protein, partial [Victivallaceae bacterium]
LAEVVGELRHTIRETEEFKNFIVLSSIYPGIVLGVTLVIVILLFTVFIPHFSQIFADMGRELPLLTLVMLKLGEIMKKFWYINLLLIGAVTYLWQLHKRQPKVKQTLDRWILRFPGLNKIIIAVEVARFIRTLAIMTQNHVHILKGISISKKIFVNTAVAEKFADTELLLQKGERLSAIFQRNSYMPGDGGAMLQIAEESGSIGEMLSLLADEEEDKIKHRIKKFIALFEPVVILFLAVVVLLVVLAVFLAIMELNVIK